MKYDKFQFIFPQQASGKTLPRHLGNFDTGEYLLHAAYGGSVCIAYTNGFELLVYDARKKIVKNVSRDIEFRKLAITGRWFAFAGSYLSQHEKAERGIMPVDRFIITDVLVWDGEYLTGTTLTERIRLLDMALPARINMIDTVSQTAKHIYFTDVKGVFRAKFYQHEFIRWHLDIVETKVYNGSVIKKATCQMVDNRKTSNRQGCIHCQIKSGFFNFK